jgi:TetR/AcrR family transcriptional regulator
MVCRHEPLARQTGRKPAVGCQPLIKLIQLYHICLAQFGSARAINCRARNDGCNRSGAGALETGVSEKILARRSIVARPILVGRTREEGQMMKEDGTKANLLKAAITVFGAHGFVGGSVRQIAEVADTNIGAIRYHYGSKENLWKETVTFLFEELGNHLIDDAPDWADIPPTERVAIATRKYIRFCAKYPELNRMILSETIENGERMQWLAENHIKMFIQQSSEWMKLAQIGGIYPSNLSTINLVFISMSVAQYIFLMAPFIEHAFDINVFEEEEIERHSDTVVKLLINGAK